jgi:hypothetical protein
MMSYIMYGMVVKVAEKGTYRSEEFGIGEKYKVIYCDDRWLAIESNKGDHHLLDEQQANDLAKHSGLPPKSSEWMKHLGKTHSWVHRGDWKLIEDACGKCINSCRDESEKCAFYQE